VRATGAARCAKNGPNHLRWALVEAAQTASRNPLYQPILERNRARHGRKRGSKLAALTIARKLTEAIWHMLTNDQPFAPAGPTRRPSPPCLPRSPHLVGRGPVRQDQDPFPAAEDG
jgi:hypothetical protein